jgi:hypothetical protein
MARDYSESAEVYRGVVSWNDPSGNFEIRYYGPYTNKAQAKSQCTREIRQQEKWNAHSERLGKIPHYHNMAGWVEVSQLNWSVA